MPFLHRGGKLQVNSKSGAQTPVTFPALSMHPISASLFDWGCCYVRDKDRFGIGVAGRNEPVKKDCGGQGSPDLRDEEERHVGWANSGEGVGQGSRNGYGWVGEGSGCGEPIR